MLESGSEEGRGFGGERRVDDEILRSISLENAAHADSDGLYEILTRTMSGTGIAFLIFQGRTLGLWPLARSWRRAMCCMGR